METFEGRVDSPLRAPTEIHYKAFPRKNSETFKDKRIRFFKSLILLNLKS